MVNSVNVEDFGISKKNYFFEKLVIKGKGMWKKGNLKD